MIKNIFIPERINDYVILTKRTVGINIHKSYIQATKLTLNKRSASVVSFHTQPIENATDRTYQERLELALKATLKAMGSYDEIRTALASSHVIFKELTVPFIDHEKIAQVVPFEIEPHLPFSRAEGVTDFIITHTDKTTNQSTIMVAATRKETIAQHLALFEAVGVQANTITVDMFDIYGLYERSQPQPGAIIIVDGGYEQTRLALVIDNKLTSIRSLSHGITTLAKDIAKAQAVETKQALEELFRFGVENPNDSGYSQAAQKALQGYWNAINFTVQAWVAQHLPGKTISSLMLTGPLVEILGIPAFFKQASSVECTLFTAPEFPNFPTQYVPSLATALPSRVTYDFNLRTDEFAPSRVSLVNKQLFTGIVLGLLTLIMLFMYGSMYMNKLDKAAARSRAEVLEYLDEAGLAPETSSVEDAIDDAETKVSQEESLWFSFSSQTRFSFLKNLEQLSSAIDREGIGLQLKKLSMASYSITLDGSVRDFKALKTLERELKKSGLFVNVPTLQETSFSNLKLMLKKQNGGTR